jgi:hypothetical protein
MAGRIRAQVSFKKLTGFVEDEVVNVWYFAKPTAGDPDATLLTTLANRIASFYNDVATGATISISSKFSPALSRAATAATIDFYWSDGLGVPSVWGSPIGTRNFFPDTATETNSLPNEVAICLSYHGDLTDVPETAVNPTPPPAIIRPAARLRGRLYLGPWSTGAVANAATVLEPIPLPSLVTAIAASATALVAANTADLVWVGQSKSDDFFWEVEGGFVDNAFDTQRRRGNASTSRTLWT